MWNAFLGKFETVCQILSSLNNKKVNGTDCLGHTALMYAFEGAAADLTVEGNIPCNFISIIFKLISM